MMKTWKIYYSVIHEDGRKSEEVRIKQAPTLRRALEIAETKIVTPLTLTAKARVIIWKIEIEQEENK